VSVTASVMVGVIVLGPTISIPPAVLMFLYQMPTKLFEEGSFKLFYMSASLFNAF
jgi:hypothetical protein